MNVRFEPVELAIDGEDEGRLVYADGRLAGVLVRLGALHRPEAGRWFLEAGFGPLDGPSRPTWADLDEAQAWLRDRLRRNDTGRQTIT